MSQHQPYSDAVPSRYRQRPVTLLLGAEGVADLQSAHGGNYPAWCREATADEVDAELEYQGDEENKARVRDMVVDHTGRPYWWVTLSPDSPGHVWREASSHLRMLRLPAFPR